MRIGVVELEAGGVKALELRPDLGGELPAGGGREEIATAGDEQIVREGAIGSDERRNLLRRKDRPAAHEDQVQPDPERGQAMRACHRIGGGRSPDHQTRGIKNALPKCLLDRLIDRNRSAEIVAGDDQPLQ
jgi:hypothetical protein